jgi:hypothetical protein
MPMKNIYTLFYSLNNVEKDENYLLELSEIEKNEKLLKETFNNLDFSPSKGIVEKILKFAFKG